MKHYQLYPQYPQSYHTSWRIPTPSAVASSLFVWRSLMPLHWGLGFVSCVLVVSVKAIHYLIRDNVYFEEVIGWKVDAQGSNQIVKK